MESAASPTPPPGGGLAPLLTVRTLPPLPRFQTSHALPPPDTSVSRLKLSIVRILTGSAESGSGSGSGSGNGSASSGAGKTPMTMTYAEQVKEMTLHGWRLQMIGLELRQNVLIAPETRDRLESEGLDEEKDAEVQGFELKDEHECALLEEGDEIIVRILPPFTLADLRLPALPSNHIYRAPPASLTRAGTLSNPPSYSSIHPRPSNNGQQKSNRPSRSNGRSHSSGNGALGLYDEQQNRRGAHQPRSYSTNSTGVRQDEIHNANNPESDRQTLSGFIVDLPPHVLRRPSEPSSHSSSVAAHPKANFHAHDYTRDYRNGWKVVKPGGAANNPFGMGTLPAAAQASAPKVKRKGSFGAAVALASPPPPPLSAPIMAPSSGSNARELALNAATRRSEAAQHPMYAAAHAARQLSESSAAAASAAAAAPPMTQSSNGGHKTAPAAIGTFEQAFAAAASANGAAAPTSSPKASFSSALSPPDQEAGTTTSGSSVTAHASAFTHPAAAPSPTTGPSPMLAGSLSMGVSSPPPGGGGSTSPALGGNSSRMPSTALIIGPGVQGQVGRNIASASAPIGSSGRGDLVDAGQGQPSYITGFTAASGEILPKKARQKSSSDWRKASYGSEERKNSMSSPVIIDSSSSTTSQVLATKNSSSGSGEKKVPLLRQLSSAFARTNLLGQPINSDSGTKRGKGKNTDSSESGDAEVDQSPAPPPKHSESPQIPPLERLASFGAHHQTSYSNETDEMLAQDAAIAAALSERDLPPMPSAADAPVVINGRVVTAHPRLAHRPSHDTESSSRQVWEDDSPSHEKQYGASRGSPALYNEPPSPLIASSQQGSGMMHSTFKGSKKKKSSISPSNRTEGSGDKTNVISVATSSKKASGTASSAQVASNKADKRYQAVQKELEKERQKQAEAEKQRGEDIRSKAERKAEEREKKEAERKKQKVKQEWEMWEEVRRREKDAGLPPPMVADRV